VNGLKLFERDMRAYLVKEEAIFERYAMEKKVEDGNKKSSDGSKHDAGTPSSVGSYQKDAKGANSYNISSDDSNAPRGGSQSQRGSGKGKKG
jgi:hypothetical protein